jgi:biopolymer transport protein ExbD
MAFGGFNNEGTSQPMAEINMIPLIDVMLVLLVIFMVTAPLLTPASRSICPTQPRGEPGEPQTVAL